MPLSLMETTHTFTVAPEDASKRLDLFLTGKLPGLTRSGIKNLLEEGLILSNGKVAKAGYKVKADDRISVTLPPPPDTLRPEEVPLDILYEDDDILVVNKPAGMPAHPGAGRKDGTLVNALLSHTGNLSRLGGEDRPGIVHRLDKDTTGALVTAKNDASYLSLARQFKEHTAGRRYLALVWGAVENDDGVIDLPLGRDTVQRKRISTRTRKSRTAITQYKVLKRYSYLTLLELRLKTGRTHQIRVHLAAINHPVVGDQVYGRRKVPPTLSKEIGDALRKMKRQCLHARTLGITHPTKGVFMEFEAKVPPDMDEILRLLERN